MGVAVSGDGSKIAMGHDGMVVVEGERWMQVTEVEGECRDVGFGRDGRCVLAYVGDRDLFKHWREMEVIEISIVEED